MSDIESISSNAVHNVVFSHHIKQTFLGPICTSCNRKVSSGNTLFNISRHSLKAHITTNKCYSGNLSSFRSQTLEKSLHLALVQYHSSMRNNPALASRITHEKFHFHSYSKNLPYCNLCGFIGSKLCHIRRHVQSNSNICSESDVRPADGTIMSNEYGFLIPRSVLDKISAGLFILPIKQTPINISLQNQTQIPPSMPTASSIHAVHSHSNTDSTNTSTSPPPATTNTTPSLRFLPTEQDVMTDLTRRPARDVTALNAFIVSELCNTFGSKEEADVAYDYLTAFVLLINQQTPGLLRRYLVDYTTMLTPNEVDTNVELLLHAGKEWFESNSANVDVRMVPVHHRNGIYLVGNTFLESDRDLLKGNTFVWSDNTDTVIDQFHSLIRFAQKIKWPQLTPFLDRISNVYMFVLEDTTNDTEDEFEIASKKLINTSIIFGLLTEMMLEDPPTPNGPNLIYKYLAGSIVKKNHNDGITLRNHNEISKHANALLRLLRHGVCSLYVRHSQSMSEKNASHKDVEGWANKLIRDMQVCPSIGHICRTIRTAREIDRKTPSKVQKSFNDRTGELLVAGTQIHKSTWSVAIPTAIAEWDKYLSILFPHHTQSSTLPLIWLFDPSNDIVIAGNDSYLSVSGTVDQSIQLSSFKPSLPQ